VLELAPILEESWSGTPGAVLFDLPEAPILDEGTPPPPRFLPDYDNVLLGHSDSSRFFVPGVVPVGWAGNLLVDGVFSGWWKLDRSEDRAQILVSLLRKVPDDELTAVGEEAEALIRFAHPDVAEREVVLRPIR
jgi:hypothetical protein